MSFKRYIRWLHIFNTLSIWTSKRSVPHSYCVTPNNLAEVTWWTQLIGTGVSASATLVRSSEHLRCHLLLIINCTRGRIPRTVYEILYTLSDIDVYALYSCSLYKVVHYYSAPVGERYIAISLSVCLSVSISLKPLDRSFKFLCRSLWPWLGPPLAALRYVMYFRFYGWRHVWP